MSKKGKRPAVLKASHFQVRQDEYRNCAGPGCKNIVAIWSKWGYCVLCRKALNDRRR